jgi:hypothetical protein
LRQFNSILFGLVILHSTALLYSHNLYITELYRNPPGLESAICGGASHEFIEIANLGNDTFRIDGLFNSDGNEEDSILPFSVKIPGHENCITNQKFLAPGQIGLILDPDYLVAVSKNGCHLPIKEQAVLFKCSDSELGNGLADDDGVVLYYGTKTVVKEVVSLVSDSLFSSETPASDKIILSFPKCSEGGSIIPYHVLWGVDGYEVSTVATPGWFEGVKNGWLVEWKIDEFKSGDSKALNCSLSCYFAGDSLNSTLEWHLFAGAVNVVRSGAINQKDRKTTIAFELILDSVDYYFSIGQTRWNINISNFWKPDFSIKINEVFPVATQNEPEWIELVNQSSMGINIKNWSFGSLENVNKLIVNDFLMPPYSHVVITKDRQLLSHRYLGLSRTIQPPAWYTLNNSCDSICIWDSKGILQDAIYYDRHWFKDWKNQSIERLSALGNGRDSTQWSVANNCTPGMPNGTSWRAVKVASVQIGPIPFTPGTDGKNDFLSIQLMIPGYQTATVSIFGFSGRKEWVYKGTTQEKYLWDGRGENGKYLPNGPFFVVVEVESSSGDKKTLRKKGILWR